VTRELATGLARRGGRGLTQLREFPGRVCLGQRQNVLRIAEFLAERVGELVGVDPGDRHDRLDILVNKVWGGYGGWHEKRFADMVAPFWDKPFDLYDAAMTAIVSKAAALRERRVTCVALYPELVGTEPARSSSLATSARSGRRRPRSPGCPCSVRPSVRAW
jgi:hypothetical protein